MAKKRASRRNSGLNLSAPKEITWIVGVVVGVAGLLTQYGGLALGVSGVGLLAVAFVILVLGTLLKGL
jgi:hypothetical protein